MLSYVIGFVAVALFPLALAGYGGHLATLAITDPKKQKRAIAIVWALAILGVVFAGLQQWQAYHADKEHDVKQQALQDKLEASLQLQQYTRGQLDSISLMIGRAGEKTTDPVTRRLAEAVSKMAVSAFNTEQLKAEALSVAAQLRLVWPKLESDLAKIEFTESKDNQGKDMVPREKFKRREAAELEYQTLKRRASELRIQIVSKLPPSSIPDPNNILGLFNYGYAEGLQENVRIEYFATYLEDLARRLP
jgi:hypothetical protein